MTQQMDEPIEYRPVSAQEAREQYEEAQAEAERLWNATTFVIALGVRATDRLAAAEMARDIAFSLWCDLAAIERSALDENDNTN